MTENTKKPDQKTSGQKTADTAKSQTSFYTDADGRQYFYAEDVPEILRMPHVLLTGEEQAQLPELLHLFNLGPMKLVGRGVDAWNLWVRGTAIRWLAEPEIKGNAYHFTLRPATGEPWEDGFFDANGIDFNKGRQAGASIRPSIDFSGFVFPCPVSFNKLLFPEEAPFSEAVFSGEAYFSKAVFKKEAYFNNVIFCRYADFGSATFEGYAYFEGASFGGFSYFEGTNFKGEALFERSVFLGGARWYNSTFEKTSSWHACHFLAEASFENAEFERSSDFDYVAFGKQADSRLPERLSEQSEWPEQVEKLYDIAPVVGPESETVPNFKGTIFKVMPNLGYTKVPAPVTIYDQWWLWFKNVWAIFAKSSRTHDANAAAKLRRLQELASDGHNKHAEKQFFRAELLCRRGHETANWFETAMINLFELFSRCGLSFWRPFGWWIVLFFVMASVYGGFSNSFGEGNFCSDLGNLFNYTLANSLPLIGVFKSQDTVAVQVLFDGVAGVPFWSGFWAGVHNLLSSIFLFFALLAIRNYFKLG